MTHFDANFDADEILREKLLKQTMRSKKKKKKNKGNKLLATTQEPGNEIENNDDTYLAHQTLIFNSIISILL